MRLWTIFAIAIATLASVTTSSALAGGGYDPVWPDAPYAGTSHPAPYADRSTGNPIYASPYVGSNMNPSMGGRTGTFGDDGVSGY